MAVTLVMVLAGFVWNRVRYDMVALAALLFLAAVDIVPRDQAFSGFGQPAVITVAAMLVVTRGLENSGVVDAVSRRLTRFARRPETLVGSHSAAVATASMFMNNVGALALFMPVAIRVSRRGGYPASIVLMPIAFASLLGGMVTLIGTPPNIVIATAGDGRFQMFDFAPVGLAVAVSGIVFLALVGWRLIPRRGTGGDESAFNIEAYLTEFVVAEGASAAGKEIREVEQEAAGEARVVALVRGERSLPAPSRFEVLAAGDILIVEAVAENLPEFLAQGLQLLAAREAAEEANEAGAPAPADHIDEAADRPGAAGSAGTEEAAAADVARVGEDDDGATTTEERRKQLDSDEVRLVEVVVRPGAMLAGRSASSLQLRARYRINILGVSRQGGIIQQRVRRFVMRPGDVLLLQAPAEGLAATLETLGALPLAERNLRFNAEPRVVAAIGIAGVALAATVAGVIPVSLAAPLAAVGMGMAGLVSLRDAYEAIDWPILVLLGAMLPVGASLETTGAAERVASAMLAVSEGLPLVLVVAMVLIFTMTLSDIVNNVAAAVLVIPIALSLAAGLDASPDAFLMAVAVGASSAFLTPIGHQSNVLVMGPGGYQFSDYWRVGLPLEVIIVVVSLPVIMLVWA